MHRKLCRAQTLTGALLLALLASGMPTGAQAQAGKALIVPIGGTVKLQMATKKPIKTVSVNVPDVVNVRTVLGDPTTLLLTGQQPNVATLELEDVDGAKEKYDVIVQLDVEYLRTQLRRVVPTANVNPIPTSTNTVVMAGTVSKVEDVDTVLRVAQSIGGIQVINALRVGGVQTVQLDVAIARVQRSKARSVGFNFLENTPNWIFGSTIGSLIPGTGALGAVGVPSAILQPTKFGQILNSAPGQANLFGGVITSHGGLIGYLQALENEGIAKIMVQQTLVALSGRPASLLDGGEQAVPVPAGLGQVGVQFEEFGVRLNVLPIVLGNGRIHLEIEPEVSTLVPNSGVTLVTGGTPVNDRATQRVNTTVEMEDGQSFVLGGLKERTVVGSIDKTPIVGELPFVGFFFSTKSYTEVETELVIMVTPHLVDAEDCGQMAKCLPGQETRSPDDFELFLEGILEAPRGQREVCVNGHYLAAYKNDPSANLFPCGGNCGNGGHGGGCANGYCGDTHSAATPAGHAMGEPAPLVPAPLVAVPRPAPESSNASAPLTPPAPIDPIGSVPVTVPDSPPRPSLLPAAPPLTPVGAGQN
jgi:pilus assembly protein CpaC